MILKEISRYLQQQRAATLGEIARHVNSEPSAVQGMLDQWIRKGKVRRSLATSSCNSSCSRCDRTAIEVYEWLGKAEASRSEE